MVCFVHAAYDDPLKYRVALLELLTDAGETFGNDDINSVRYNVSLEADINCVDTCDSIRLLKMSVLEKANYIIEVELTNIDNIRPYIDHLKFDTSISSKRFAVSLIVVRSLLFVLSVAMLTIYEVRLRLVSDKFYWLFEQKGIRLLNVLLVMYYDPISILEYTYPSQFSYPTLTRSIWMNFWTTAFLSGLYYYLMVMFAVDKAYLESDH